MGELLDKVNGPDDLRKLTVPELKTLAEEIRQFMLTCVSRTGGHLASNLGVVELTLALHYVFQFDRDKLIWDVGHQCYTHKIITGRRLGFERLRQAGGVSGFPNPRESHYDQFTVGHAGTAIPTAIGLALGERIRAGSKSPEDQESQRRIVAFVGDASIVNGNSFEGLNNLGLVKRQLLIVLNDNSMAIDPTVGALAKYFSKIRLSHTYDDIRKITSTTLEHVPKIGRSMEDAMERLKKHIRMVMPGSQLFESLNIPYFGPVDGHDIGALIQLFKALENVPHPVLLHVYTKKGKGFTPADNGPSRFHSTGPFTFCGDEVEITPQNNRPTFTQEFGRYLTDLARTDDRIVAITSAMCDGTGLKLFRERFPDRFFDVGIAESTAVDIAAGLAHSGLRPVVCIYSTFLQRAFDQISQEVAMQNLPVVFCVDRAGFVGTDGPTHHGVMDIGYLRMLPNMILTAPANGPEVNLALAFALGQDRPVVIRYPKDSIPPQQYVRVACEQAFAAGSGVFIKKGDHSDLTIVSYGAVLEEVLKAEEILDKKGIHANVFNARFAAPVDSRLALWAQRGQPLLTVEDHQVSCGFGSAVLESIMTVNHGNVTLGRMRILGGPRTFIGHNSRAQQLMQAGVSADDIVTIAQEMLTVSDTESIDKDAQETIVTQADIFRRLP